MKYLLLSALLFAIPTAQAEPPGVKHPLDDANPGLLSPEIIRELKKSREFENVCDTRPPCNPDEVAEPIGTDENHCPLFRCDKAKNDDR
jgi:hypothetical protein